MAAGWASQPRSRRRRHHRRRRGRRQRWRRAVSRRRIRQSPATPADCRGCRSLLLLLLSRAVSW